MGAAHAHKQNAKMQIIVWIVNLLLIEQNRAIIAQHFSQPPL